MKAPDGQTAASWHSEDYLHPEYTAHPLYCHGPERKRKTVTATAVSSERLILLPLLSHRLEGLSCAEQSVLASHMNAYSHAQFCTLYCDS